MDNKKGIKTIVLTVIVAVAVTAAFLAGSFIGRNNSISTGNSAEGTRPETESYSSENSEQNRVSDDIFNLITAFDEYMKANVQQAEIEINFTFGSLGTDEKFSVKTGVFDGVSVNHIQHGKLDIYICDGQVFVEDDNAHFSLSKTDKYDKFSMREMFAVAYEIVQKGDFSIETEESETVYTLALTQQQIEDILDSLQGTMGNNNAVIEKGVFRITVENGTLESFDIICNGYIQILSSDIDGSISIETDLSVSEEEIAVPSAVMEQLK